MLIGNGLAASEGSTWRKRRALINPLLRGEHLKQLVPTVCDSVCEVLKDWEDKRVHGTPIEVVRETQRLAMGAISRMLLSTDIGRDTSHRLGTAMREAMQLLREYNTSLFPIPLSCPVHRNRKFHGHRETLDRFIDGHIKSRQANGQPDKPDFLSVLMAAEDPDSGERLPQQALIDETKTLFLAGFETTSSAMSWALYLLASHPECAAKWQEEVDRVLQGRLPQWDDLPKLTYITQILQETMRLYPPFYSLARQCVREDRIAGYTVPKFATILISIYGIHRDPVWGSDRRGISPGTLRPEGRRSSYRVYTFRNRQACLRGKRLQHDGNDHHACHPRPALPVDTRRRQAGGSQSTNRAGTGARDPDVFGGEKMNDFQFELLNPSDPAAVQEYEAAFYQAFAKVTTNRLVQKLWLWDHETGRLKTRVPYQDQLICTLRDQAGRLRSAMAFNVELRQFQAAAYGFAAPPAPLASFEVLTFFALGRTDARCVCELLVKLSRAAQWKRTHDRLCHNGAPSAAHVSASRLASIAGAGNRIGEALFSSLRDPTIRTERRGCTAHSRLLSSDMF